MTPDQNSWKGRLLDALSASGILLRPDEVEVAAVTASVLALCILAGVSLAMFLLAPDFVIAALIACVVAPVTLWEMIIEFPARVARTKAARLAREAPEATNLMIMSIRHEPSLSNSISFASTRRNSFSAELRGCVWQVLIGRHSSFEEALQQFGATWERYCPDVKSAMNAMITATCERTEDGKRRALDRASRAIVSGTKRRIEEYALSLSFPSMLLFGVGILLPLMVGSFMPMTSWGMWSYEAIDSSGGGIGTDTTAQTAFVMNLLFPSVAFVVSIGAVAKHPLEVGPRYRGSISKAWLVRASAAATASAFACLASVEFLDGLSEAFALLMSLVLPMSVALILAGGRSNAPVGRLKRAADIENALFRTGARMVEGENFQSALHKAAKGLDEDSRASISRLVFGSLVAENEFPDAVKGEDGGGPGALNLVRDAAGKDEQSAGLLAMDLAVYLQDLRELESTLKTRLRPTISMMKTTAYALGPVVLGITFAIYLSLESIVSPGSSLMSAGAIFLILGIFLVESNLIVTYFVWGIEGEGDRSRLMRSAGICILCSTMVFSASALVTS